MQGQPDEGRPEELEWASEVMHDLLKMRVGPVPESCVVQSSTL